jgi:hypothetical protein
MKSPRRIDVPEVLEVFVDELRFMTYDGHQLRLEFDVIRKDGGAPDDEGRLWAYTASRIVMSAHGVPALLDQMARLQSALAEREGGEGQRPQAEPVLQWKGRREGAPN